MRSEWEPESGSGPGGPGPEGPRAAGFEEAVGELQAWLAKVDYWDLAGLPAAELAGLLEQITTVSNQVDALRVAAVGEVDSAGLALHDGLRTATWVANRTRRQRGSVCADLHQARVLRRLPLTAEAFRAGRITQAHVTALVALHRGTLAPLLERDEGYLLPVAETDTYPRFLELLEAWKLAADPDGPPPPDERRSFRMRRTLQGWMEGTLRVDTLTGVELLALLERVEKAEWEADWAEARRLHGEGATDADLRRTPEQRRCDALLILLRRGAGNPDGSEPRPVVNVVLTQDEFEQALAEAAGLPVDPVDPTTVTAGAGPRLADGTPLANTQVIELALRGFVRRIIVDPAGRPIAISSRQRLYTGPLREVLLSLVRTCEFPGCDTPSHRCEIDHIRPWREVGTTDAANAQALCDFHQKLKERGFTPHRRPDGTRYWTRPDGTRLE